MRWILCAVVGAVVVAGGCMKQPPAERRTPVSNTGYEVEELFTDQRGVSIYRFYDMGDWRYYAVGPGGAQMLPTTARRHTPPTGSEQSPVIVVPRGK